MKTTLIVIGSLCTDIVASGLKRFPRPGEHVYGKDLTVSPGGKSRNIAAMAAQLIGAGKVAIVGRTAQDAYGLWRVPLDTLHSSGVNTDFVVIDQQSSKLPAATLITVDEQGRNQIVVISGASDDFGRGDVDSADQLFKGTVQNGGCMAITLECPFDSVRYAIDKAKKMRLKVILDPGGIDDSVPARDLLDGLYMIKPNEHEAKVLTGTEVRDLSSAKQAAEKLQQMGVQNVLITAGAHGAYLFTSDVEKQIQAPLIQGDAVRDETGCGDQAMAVLCASLLAGKSVEEAAESAIHAGTLQFHKRGVQPITSEELTLSLSGDAKAQ